MFPVDEVRGIANTGQGGGGSSRGKNGTTIYNYTGGNGGSGICIITLVKGLIFLIAFNN